MARFPQLPDSPSPTHGQTLQYDDNLKRWVPSDGGGGVTLVILEADEDETDIPPGTPLGSLVFRKAE